MNNERQSALIARLGGLIPDQRLHLFEIFAHNLTVAARGAWSNSGLSAEEQVQALKAINECLHRATSRIWVERLRTHEWTDLDFVKMVSDCDNMLHPLLRGSLGWALATSLDAAERMI